MIALDLLQEQVGVWSRQAFGDGVRFDQHVFHIGETLKLLPEWEAPFAGGKAGEADKAIVGRQIADAVILLISLADRCGINVESAVAVAFSQIRAATAANPKGALSCRPTPTPS